MQRSPFSIEIRRTMVLCAAFVLTVAWPLAAVAETATRTVWIDAADERGRPVETLDAQDLDVREDGAPVAGLALSPGVANEGKARVVLYFDAILASAGNYRRGAEVLATQIAALTRLGTVELVIADPEPLSVLVTEDALALGERLGWLGASDRGRGMVAALREQTLRELESAPGQPSVPAEARAEIVRQASAEERALVVAQLERMLAWAGSAKKPAGGPAIVVPVLDGFDLDPALFYAQVFASEAGGSASMSRALTTSMEDVARSLAARGWTAVPLAVAKLTLPETTAEPIEAIRSAGGDDAGSLVPGPIRNPQVRLGRKRERDSEARPPVGFLAPLAPLEMMAAATGGSVIASAEGFGNALARLARRWQLRYESTLGIDQGLVALEVASLRRDLAVRAPRWTSRAVPAPIAAVRLRQILAGANPDGGLDVASAARLGSAVTSEAAAAAGLVDVALETRLSLRPLADAGGDLPLGLGSVPVRVMVAWEAADGSLARQDSVLLEQDLRSDAEWRYDQSLSLPVDTGQVAVLVENLEDGRWGGGLAAMVRADAGEVVAELTPRATVIEISRPEDELLRGKVVFETDVYDSRVSEVAFVLDDTEVARVNQRPFSARVNLGRTPRRRTLTVIAFGGSGMEMGRNSAVLNSGSGGLGVRIVAPTIFQVSGPVDVEAEITVPVERNLDRVLFFWNDDLLATQYAAPFRQRIVVPESRPQGFARVVAMLDDGTVTEDVVVLNGPEAGERVDVNLVELYVVVTDGDGRPVRGLTVDDFAVQEEGKPQKVASFSDASDLPLTLGMAIDSSASMFVKLPTVQRSAIRFLESTFGERDRAFVVDFDSQPRLARGTTAELPRVVTAINDLEASGRTALWESIVFSLVQLQGVRGRKALVVFSDGADEDDEFPYRACVKLAKQMGVPIYLILMKKRPKNDDAGLSLWTRSFNSKATKLATSVGGRVYYAKEYASLDEVYTEIEEELRSQYLLAYYPTQVGASGLWRSVDVNVRKRGLVPRTLSGYWP